MFNELISYANHLGLFSEDLDFETKDQLGNFPQAYSHLALIDTALLFSKEDRRTKIRKAIVYFSVSRFKKGSTSDCDNKL